ncbi:alpha/beta hydrolase [Mycobacterium sp. IDR2000157661]|uniref:alpha/beta hydrolase n=1 Tax=Mycobacterium sp. IDR2000157661 TaxID=2867005 RepID=UPI001EEE9231|nr:alpha/beta hydrolase [Mycobacterium sp. IDR2000157661]ULE35818.1 alpha/beta hydrolase [Mycobacterium sp. IDR2000157661]
MLPQERTGTPALRSNPHGQPSSASFLVALAARGLFRPLTQAVPANQAGLSIIDAVLRGALIASGPRRGVHVTPVDQPFDGNRVRGDWVLGPGVDKDDPPILYIHGGAFAMCSPKTHRGLMGEVSAASRRPVFAVRYRLAPRHPYPAAADDALTAYRWLTCDRPGAPGGGAVAVAGDSAGGQLAVATALGARAHGLPAPDAMLLMSPVLDLTCRLALARDLRCSDPFASAVSAARSLALYAGCADPTDPRISVLDTDLSDMPPTLIQVGGREMLLDDSRRFADRMQLFESSADLQVWRGQIHVFQAMFRVLPEARAALRSAGEFLSGSAERSSTQSALARPIRGDGSSNRRQEPRS